MVEIDMSRNERICDFTSTVYARQEFLIYGRFFSVLEIINQANKLTKPWFNELWSFDVRCYHVIRHSSYVYFTLNCISSHLLLLLFMVFV